MAHKVAPAISQFEYSKPGRKTTQPPAKLEVDSRKVTLRVPKLSHPARRDVDQQRLIDSIPLELTITRQSNSNQRDDIAKPIKVGGKNLVLAGPAIAPKRAESRRQKIVSFDKRRLCHVERDKDAEGAGLDPQLPVVDLFPGIGYKRGSNLANPTGYFQAIEGLCWYRDLRHQLKRSVEDINRRPIRLI